MINKNVYVYVLFDVEKRVNMQKKKEHVKTTFSFHSNRKQAQQ